MSQSLSIAPSRHSLLQVVNSDLPQKAKSPSIKAFPIKKSFNNKITPLQQQVMRIHYLTTELEQAIYDLKSLSQKTSFNYSTQIHQQKQKKSCQYGSIYLPKISQNIDGTFTLVSKELELFQDEKRAYNLAKKLRKKQKKKLIK